MARKRSRGGDWRGLHRRKAFRDKKKRILIFAEGRKTEPGYLAAFARVHRDVAVVIERERGVPKTLVERAAARKKLEDRHAKRRGSFEPGFDEVWCVFDIDEHPNVPDAKQQARDNGVRLAVSNPCFELWALLHFQDQTAHIERDDVVRLLCEYIPDYVKALPYEKLEPRYEDAVRRSIALEKRHENAFMDRGSNPSTGMYVLLRTISGSGG